MSLLILRSRLSSLLHLDGLLLIWYVCVMLFALSSDFSFDGKFQSFFFKPSLLADLSPMDASHYNFVVFWFWAVVSLVRF